VIAGLIAKLRGMPDPFNEMEEQVGGNLDIVGIRARYSQEAWDKILRKNPELQHLIDRFSKLPLGKEYRNVRAEIVKWFYDHEQLPE